jgi:hypothetical protein
MKQYAGAVNGQFRCQVSCTGPVFFHSDLHATHLVMHALLAPMTANSFS